MSRSEMFAQRVAELDRRYPGYEGAWNAFAEVILAHGGELVVPPLTPDILIDMLKTDGRVWEGASRTVPGNPRHCHENVVALWRAGHVEAVGTGYALSEDGLWREHSWGVDDDGTAIETTTPRIRYFGIKLAHDNAAWFADWIEGPPSTAAEPAPGPIGDG